jgi:transcriptional regulator with XRE-family HTH domain
MPSPTLGSLLRDARHQAGLTLVTVAKQVGISVAHLSRVELDAPDHGASVAMLGALAKALKVNVDTIFFAAGRVPPDLEQWLVTTEGAIALVRKQMARRKVKATKRAS